MPNDHFYITTTLPYVNSAPHIGFAMEIIAADVIARYQRLLGKKVVFNTGTDEHGQKIYQKALEAKMEPQAYVDEYAEKFKELKELLNLSITNFIRTTEARHIKAAQEFWKRCDSNGDIYKKMYKIKYCVGCELEKQASELVKGRCPLHPQAKLEVIEEENYFFRFSKYQDKLLELYERVPNFVRPGGKMKEIREFVKRGLKDFSISRLKTKMPWGIEVPDDPKQVQYVWFDALINYISTLGWPDDEANFKKYWPGTQIAGKDNLRQQAAMWQAMLMSAQLPNSTEILINGFISVDGQKMSKSLGNVIAPSDLVKKFGIDASRYLLMDLGPVGSDMDVSYQKFTTSYNADLANGLGNLISRVAALAASSDAEFKDGGELGFSQEVKMQLDSYRLDLGLSMIWRKIKELDKYIDRTTPWKLKGDKLNKVVVELVNNIRLIGFELSPFMPEAAEKIAKQFKGPKVSIGSPLFPRI